MIFGNLISIGISLLFMNLQDRTYALTFSQNSHPNPLHSRQSGMGGLGSKGGGMGGLASKGAGGGEDSGGCKTYMMMGARGTTEAQGSSMAYTKMAKNVLQAVPGGGLMDIQYSSSAEYMKSPKDGAQTGLKYLKAQASKCPKMVFVLMGYSKGAMVQSQILAAKDLPPNKVVAVVLFGNPYFTAGAPQNKCDAKKGKGIAAAMMVKVPKDYTSLIWDCCLTGDMICQSSGGMTTHMKYGGKPASEAQAFIVGKLKGVKEGGGSGGVAAGTADKTSDTGAASAADGADSQADSGMGSKFGGGMGSKSGGGMGSKLGGGMGSKVGGGTGSGGDETGGKTAGKMGGKMSGLMGGGGDDKMSGSKMGGLGGKMGGMGGKMGG
ncbi:hypothetical protein PGT21_011944 [Puccinia graminis f. sp. tritici]|uniref:Cutinase n=1 Tax=Puccinia graminis f. sp. tritici TaxID=56615 RepID=A0A5B0LU26_PUCGR|nr:hypothetical protein PGTUg99_026069 [Puccinia graminis f. sp. tritici]KAA1071571.1 hypothetical protein PGT21_011944 [Puccinia graminis f. sp. tritici]